MNPPTFPIRLQANSSLLAADLPGASVRALVVETFSDPALRFR